MLSIIGAQRASLILKEEMTANSDQIYFTTDDGSYGRAGLVTDVLEDLSKPKNRSDDLCRTCTYDGTVELCKAASQHQSLTNYGRWYCMCGCCRVSIAGETKFAW